MLIDPRTGRPTKPSLSQERDALLLQITDAVNEQGMRLNALSQQQVHLGLFLEYFSTKLLELKNEDGSPMFPLGMEEFPEWANAKLEEMRKQAAEQRLNSEEATAPDIFEAGDVNVDERTAIVLED